MAGLGRRFELGNKASKGRRRGSRNKLTLFREALESNGVAIIEKVIEQALRSDPMALRLCVERLIPVPKSVNKPFTLPPSESATSSTETISAVTRAVADGELNAQEGEAVARIVESKRRVLESEEFEARLKALEQYRAGRREETR